MSPLRPILLVLLSLLLCQCATKHQPLRFNASYSRYPDELFSGSTVKECRELESRKNLTALEKKRLADLYMIEARQVKGNSARLQELSERAEKLKTEVEPLLAEFEALKVEVNGRTETVIEPGKVNFDTPGLKREFSQAYQLWNKDDNDAALARVKVTLSNEELRSNAKKGEWTKILSLRFRIAHDLANLEEVKQAYLDLKASDECAPETANAGFLYSLLLFIKNEPGNALATYKDQCDKDESLSNRTRRAYWMYRFNETLDPKAKEVHYQELIGLALPGYYVYMAKARKGERFELPKPELALQEQYLDSEFDVPSKVSPLLLTAEERLKSGLKKDASLYLMKAVQYLKDEPGDNILPLLYVAHLFRAAGNHLEAMKTFSLLVGGEKAPGSEWTPLLQTDFMQMFPRPFSEQVTWLSKNWQVDDDFIYAIMRQESAFNPGAISHAGARGLMQFMPTLARSLSQNWKYRPYGNDTLLLHADENLKLATYHMHQLKLVAPHFALMAAAYNAGINRTSTWWRKFGSYPLDVFVELIPVTETKNYVKLVLRNYLYYKSLKTNSPLPADTVALTLPPYGMSRSMPVLP